MNRKTRTVSVLAIALMMASLASYAVYRVVAGIPVRQVEVAHEYVVVAARSLPVGTRLTADDVKLVAWPKANPIPGAFAAIDQVEGRGVTSAVMENEPIVEARIAPVGLGAGLPPAIPPGMRAISVKVDEVVGVAGFVVPGTHVDVLVTVRPGAQHDQMSRVVVSNVTVLTAGTRYDQEEAKSGKPVRSTVVTLMVTPEDAERVALAQSEGDVMLALRNPLDTAPAITKGVRLATLMGDAGSPSSATIPRPAAGDRAAARSVAVTRGAAPIARPIVAVANQPYTVETIRAAKRTEEVVR